MMNEIKSNSKQQTARLLYSLVLAIFFSITCSNGTANNPTPTSITPPAISGDYTFTYKTQASQMFTNSGGAIESYKLITGTLPDGLELDVTDGQLFIVGTPTKVTLNEAKAQIASVPLEIEVTNEGGTSMTSVNVTINPKFVSGDQSMGVVHDNVAVNAGGMHTHSCGGCTTVTHIHNADNNDSNLIHTANDISFASGGTGSVSDPVLIGVRSDATNLSFVVNYTGVLNKNTFHIQLIGIPVGATIAKLEVEYMKDLDALISTEVVFIFPPLVTEEYALSIFGGEPLGLLLNSTGEGGGGFLVTSSSSLVIEVKERKGVDASTALVSQVRLTIEITPPA